MSGDLSTTLNALPMAAKHPAWDLVRHAQKQAWDTAQIEITLTAMGNEILRLRSDVAAVQVDKDHSVVAALAQAQDCAAHGENITHLRGQVHHLDEQARRNDAGRMVLLGLLHSIDGLVEAMGTRTRLEEALPTSEELLASLAGAVKKASAAHDRAWKK